MPTISANALALIIQAVDREIMRLTDMSDDIITPAEELRLVKYESLADDLEELYTTETEGRQTNLPPYNDLVTDRDQDDED